MEFVLLVGKRKVSKAMKKGSARHAKLEEEVRIRDWLFYFCSISGFVLHECYLFKFFCQSAKHSSIPFCCCREIYLAFGSSYSYLHVFYALLQSDYIFVQVVKKVKVRIESIEDRWALKLLNFITGVNQLLFEGLTRELPL